MSVSEQPEGPVAAGMPAVARRTLATTCAAHFVHDGIADALYVILPIWAQAFGLSYVQVGTLRMAYSAAMAFLQLPAGMLAERIGERALLAGGSVLAGVAFALLATSQSYAGLGALILLAGTGSAVQHPIASTLISRAYAAASRRAALGVYNFVGDVGKMVVAAAMGLGIVAIGWRSSVVLYGSDRRGRGAAHARRARALRRRRAAQARGCRPRRHPRRVGGSPIPRASHCSAPSSSSTVPAARGSSPSSRSC